MTPLDPAHRLSANAEASRDALLHLTSLDGLENPSVPLLAQPHVLPPSIDLRESRIGSLALDAEVGARQPQNGLDVFTVEEDEREPLPPMRLLLLRANGTEAKAIPNLLEYVDFAVGEDDSDPIAGALDVPLAIQEAGEITRENIVRKALNRHAIAYHAVTVTVANWIAHRIRQAA